MQYSGGILHQPVQKLVDTMIESSPAVFTKHPKCVSIWDVYLLTIHSGIRKSMCTVSSAVGKRIPGANVLRQCLPFLWAHS